MPAPSPTRIQRYTAVLDLELPTPHAVSAASRKAVAIATSLSGYQQAVTVRTTTQGRLRAHRPSRPERERPRGHSPSLRAREDHGRERGDPGSPGSGERQTDKHIARLQIQLAALVAQPQTTELDARIASVTAQIERLQRSRAATVRAAHYATIDLQLATRQAAAPKKENTEPGPLHGLGTAFHWAWIGAVYALALGAPVVALAIAIWLLARTVRRRREDALLAS